MKNGSPLRYPGGKAIMTNFFIDLFAENRLTNIVYVEPYAGGAGAAINLLLRKHVDRIIINDANSGIYSFWYALLNESARFIQTINDIPVTLDEWHHQKEILKSTKSPSFELGVATFFLSRTNRSGVISGGAIGGTTTEKQNSAKYKIDCRFNKPDLLARLNAIVNQKERITICNQDALHFLKNLNEDVFVYLDPPYYIKGKYLYMNHYTDKSHKELADLLQHDANFKWVLSYDDTPQIRSMYEKLELFRFPLTYTVKERQVGYELLTHSESLKIPEEKIIRRNQRGNIALELVN